MTESNYPDYVTKKTRLVLVKPFNHKLTRQTLNIVTMCHNSMKIFSPTWPMSSDMKKVNSLK